MVNWSDDGSLWAAMTPALSAPIRYELADAEVATIDRIAGLAPGARVLDLGCGAGVHAVGFAARGYRVTGVDKNAGLLRLAEKRASETGISAEFVHGDMRHFVRRLAFDLACSLNASFAYFEDEVNARVLRNIRRSLRKGATLVLDTLGEGVIRAIGDGERHELAGTVYSVFRSFDNARGMLREDWTVDLGGSRQRYRVEQRVYTAIELRFVLRTVGFRTVALSESLDGVAPYNKNSLRLIALAKS